MFFPFELFLPPIAVVRFKTREDAIKASKLLSRGYLVEFVGDRTYGLHSKRQLELLDASGIPYEKIEKKKGEKKQ